MIRIHKGAVERIIKAEDYPKWKQAGFQPVDPLSDLPELEEVVSAPDPEPETETPEHSEPSGIPDDLEKMKVSELRDLADRIGVQGYQNMDKATLIAVIQAH